MAPATRNSKLYTCSGCLSSHIPRRPSIEFVTPASRTDNSACPLLPKGSTRHGNHRQVSEPAAPRMQEIPREPRYCPFRASEQCPQDGGPRNHPKSTAIGPGLNEVSCLGGRRPAAGVANCVLHSVHKASGWYRRSCTNWLGAARCGPAAVRPCSLVQRLHFPRSSRCESPSRRPDRHNENSGARNLHRS